MILISGNLRVEGAMQKEHRPEDVSPFQGSGGVATSIRLIVFDHLKV